MSEIRISKLDNYNKNCSEKFIEKVIKVFKHVKDNRNLPDEPYVMTGFILDPENNLVTLCAGTCDNSFDNPYHLKDDVLVGGDDELTFRTKEEKVAARIEDSDFGCQKENVYKLMEAVLETEIPRLKSYKLKKIQKIHGLT